MSPRQVARCGAIYFSKYQKNTFRDGVGDAGMAKKQETGKCGICFSREVAGQ